MDQVDPNADERAGLVRGPEGAWLRAMRFNDAGRHDLAEQALGEGLAEQPDNADLQAELARTHLLRERWAEAESSAREALATDPEQPVACSVLGAALMNLGRNTEAERVLLGALRSAPDTEHLLYQYATLLFRVGRLDKAESVARRALALDPDDADNHQLLALILAERKQRRSAVQHGEKGVALDAGDATAHLVQGAALAQSGHPFRARRHLREALRLAPSPEAESAFRDIDTMCRPPGLPLYWFGRLCERVPGQQFTIWVAFIVVIQLGRAVGVPLPVLLVVSLAYLALALYTWIGLPIARLWVRIFPPR